MECQQAQSPAGSGPIIILPVDASKHSDFAFDYYAKQVHKKGNRLHVVHCHEGWSSHPMDGGLSPAHAQELETKDKKTINELKDKYLKLMKDNGIEGEFNVVATHRHKDAWHDIVEYQQKNGGIMIVMGSRGQGAIRRTVMGSVSDAVVHHAHCPVLVCRHS